MDKPQVLDQRGQEQDWIWLIDNFGDVVIERAEVSDAVAQVYRIAKVQVSEGPAVQVVNVADQDGIPLGGHRVVRYWPDAPFLPVWLPPTSMWQLEGVFGETNVEGNIGFGMGHGDYYDPPEGGASSVWVASEAGPSDLIWGLGMLGGTNHRHLDVYFRLVSVEGTPPGEPPDQPPVVSPPVDALPGELPGEQWQALFEKLDLIIDMLEKEIEQ